MKIYEVARNIISEYIEKRDSIPMVIDKVKREAGEGNIAFYPCSRYANLVVEEIKKVDYELFSRIESFYDKSPEANSDTGVKVQTLSALAGSKNGLSLLVVCSNTFHENDFNDAKNIAGYRGKVIKTSYFDITFPNQTKEKIMADLEKVYNLLEDKKSRMAYLFYWLSKALNDESITYLFEGENNTNIDGQETLYKRYVLKNLGDVCAHELHSELYKMRHVYPEKGDTVLDIGGYKGDTAIFFADAVGPNGKVYVFEPTASNLKMLEENVKSNGLEDIISPLNKGVSDKPGKTRAVSIDSGAPWSFLTEGNGNEEVMVTTIDEFVKEQDLKKLDFIKMDVEGHEHQVITGGEKSIKKFTPKLAIPLYHKTSDLTVLPLLVNEFVGKYKLYFRCKMEGPFGATLYCINEV